MSGGGNLWSGFYKKPLSERWDQLALVFSDFESWRPLLENGGLEPKTADLMIENCIGVCSMPLGVVPVFVLNGDDYVVPMAVEEPSVVAAASSACKLIASYGGFKGISDEPLMVGQIYLSHPEFKESSVIQTARESILSKKSELVAFANKFCPGMVARDGGVCDLDVRDLRGDSTIWIVVDVTVNVCEAMGANIVNTIVEGLAPEIENMVPGSSAVLKILSNLCLKRMSFSKFEIPIAALAWKDVPGDVVANRIIELVEIAGFDPLRATTHNKGIMNGIDAVALATGQDWRAIEAGCHAFATTKGSYGPLSRYYIHKEMFCGDIKLPIAIGTCGGALKSHSVFEIAHKIMGRPSVQTLSQIIVSIGLAQNFAALRALAVEGIQKGHMALHARNIAIAAGAPSYLVPEVIKFMKTRHSINDRTAKEYLRLQSSFVNSYLPSSAAKIPFQPSTLHIKFVSEDILSKEKENVSIDVVFETLCDSDGPQHIYVTESDVLHPMQHAILGSDKGLMWLSNAYKFMQSGSLRLNSGPSLPFPRSNEDESRKLKLLSLVLNLVCRRLSDGGFRDIPSIFTCSVKKLPREAFRAELTSLIKAHEPSPSKACWVAVPLAAALFKSFNYLIQDQVHPFTPNLASAISNELLSVVDAIQKSRDATFDLKSSPTSVLADRLHSSLCIYSKRMQITLLILCDAICVPASLISDSAIRWLYRAGQILEKEIMIAHDVSGFHKDELKGIHNVYRLWLKAFSTSDSVESATGFRKFCLHAICPSVEGTEAIPLLEYLEKDWLKNSVELIQLCYDPPLKLVNTYESC
jgi:hydroxymethylglutaryl-CoA synthase